MRKDRFYFSNVIDGGKSKLYNAIRYEKWEFDIAGYIDICKLRHVINNRFILVVRPLNMMGIDFVSWFIYLNM